MDSISLSELRKKHVRIMAALRSLEHEPIEFGYPDANLVQHLIESAEQLLQHEQKKIELNEKLLECVQLMVQTSPSTNIFNLESIFPDDCKASTRKQKLERLHSVLELMAFSIIKKGWQIEIDRTVNAIAASRDVSSQIQSMLTYLRSLPEQTDQEVLKEIMDNSVTRKILHPKDNRTAKMEFQNRLRTLVNEDYLQVHLIHRRMGAVRILMQSEE